MAGSDLLQHSLVPVHRVLSEEEKLAVLKKFNVSEFQLPSIRKKDPAVVNLKMKAGDVIEITRDGKTGEYMYYRRVI